MTQLRLWLITVAIAMFWIDCRTWQEAQQLAHEYASKMTLDEKVSILQGQGGLLGPCVGTTSAVNGQVKIPEICMQDGPAGLRQIDELVTGFPAGISVAATWNRRLMRLRAEALGRESRRKGVHVLLGPAVDVTRAHQFGRAWESAGPSDYLNGELAYETVMGIQSQGVQACAKHFIGYHQEHFRWDMSANIDDRTLREVYFKPFQRAIDAEVVCVMSSYNKLNGTWASKSPMLKKLLREEGGFQGYVVSDWGGTHGSLISATDVHETVDAGLDVEMPGGFAIAGGSVYRKLKRAVEKNYDVTMDKVDVMVVRFLSAWFKVNQDQNYPPISFNVHKSDGNKRVDVRSEEHTKLVRTIGAASIVLLKNNNKALPLSTPQSMAVIGIDAADIKGGKCDLNACDFKGTVPIGWGSGSNSLDHVVAPFLAISSHISSKQLPTILTSSLTQDLEAAKKAATTTEVALVFVYTFSGEIGLGFTQIDQHYGDRNNLNLFQQGNELIQAVASVNPNTIVIMHTVGPVIVEPWVDHPNVTAIINAGLPGEQTGPAIVDVLFGIVNPSGKLPYTITKSDRDYGLDVSEYNPLKSGFTPSIDYNERFLVDYKRLDALNIEPRYPFGFGLSYTTFTYSDLKIVSGTGDEVYHITATISNTGPVDGTEVIQLYLGFPDYTQEPPKLLRGFDAIAVGKGQSQIVKFVLKQADVKVYDIAKSSWIRPHGQFQVFVGASSRDIRLTGSF